MVLPYAFVRPDPTMALINLTRLADGAIIPADPANADYAAFLAAGSLADPAPAIVVPIVTAVRPVALRWVLRRTPDPAGKAANALEAINTALADPAMVDAQDAWNYGVMIYRADLLALGGGLGFTATEIDAALTAAAAIPGSGAEYGAP